MDARTTLGGEEKTFLAMAAAMGGGCRTCAERLSAVAQSLDVDQEAIDRAFVAGLEVRDAATRLMREKARSLGFRGAESADAPGITRGDRLQELARLAAAVAAKAAPVALGYAEAARNVGASEAAIGVAIGIGRTVRAKAQAFSDEELGEGAEGKEGARGPKGTCSCRASP